MAGTRWRRIEELFEASLPLPGPQRRELLAQACGADRSLRAEIEAMVAAETPDRALGIERMAPDEEPADTTPDPVLGRTFGPWRTIRVLGQGGMGTVYLAERADGHYRQEAALKLASSSVCRPETESRFRTERQVLARLGHPNIARLLDGGIAWDGRPYFVMELVDGAPITQWCRTRNLSIGERLRLFRVVCEAVQHAHSALVIHRDLKPANIFVSSDGEVKLLDFGIAKLLEPETFGLQDSATRRGEMVLTPEYAAPEQILGGPITTATDVYALGVVLYELLTGVRPLALEGKTPVQVEQAITSTRIAPPSELLGKRRRDDLDSIVLTTLRAHRERRYVSAAQLGEELDRFVGGRPVLAQPDTLGYRARRFITRNRAAVVGAAAVAASLALFGVVAGWQARLAAAQRDVARLEREKAEKVVGLLVDLFEGSDPKVRPDGDRMSVREFLASAQPRVLDRLEGEPVVRARLQQVFGLIYSARSQFAEARRALEGALADQRRLVGPDHPDALESLHQLGTLVNYLGEIPLARSLLEESLGRHRRVFGEDHPHTARALAALGSTHTNRGGRIEDACPLFEAALEIRRRVLPPHHADLAASLSALALCRSGRGDLQGARALYEESLAIFRTPQQRRHPGAIDVMNALAAVLGQLDATTEAEQLQVEALTTARSLLGSDSATVANLLNNHAVTLTRWGRHAEAERVFREAHQRHLALLGEGHWRTANAARNVGQILALQQRYREGLSWIERALAPGNSDHTLGRHSMNGQRALMLLRLGRGAEALSALESTEAALLALDAGDSGRPVLADVRVWLARALSENGRPARAERPARAALAELDALGADHPKRAEAACELGRALVETGRAKEGRAILAQCLPVYRAWGLAHREVVQALERLLAAPVDR